MSADRFANLFAFNKLSEDAVIEVKKSLRPLRDKKLRIVSIVTGFSVRQHARSRVHQISIKIVVKITQRRTTRSGCRRIACLQHKVIDDAMELNTIIKVLIGQRDHTSRRIGSTVFEQLEHHVAIAVHVDTNRPVAR